RELCKREGIDLIEIPYTADLYPYIKNVLIEKDLTREKNDPFFIRAGWDQPLEISNE
ncbi:12700_t:CDS:2, partial [Entrophospora sp. SA101]